MGMRAGGGRGGGGGDSTMRHCRMPGCTQSEKVPMTLSTTAGTHLAPARCQLPPQADCAAQRRTGHAPPIRPQWAAHTATQWHDTARLAAPLPAPPARRSRPSGQLPEDRRVEGCMQGRCRVYQWQ